MVRSAACRDVLLFAALLTCVLPGLGGAALRSPQVPVLTGRLQAYLNSVGESIDVATDQKADSTLGPPPCPSDPVEAYQLERAGSATSDSMGIYDLADPSTGRVTLFPAEARPGWFAVLSFRRNPDRVVVNLFDANAALVRITKTPGGDVLHTGFWAEGPNETVFSESFRNPRSAVQVLFFAGTGINTGSEWICFEDEPVGAGSDQDYDDQVFFIETPSDCSTPVHRSSWAAVKERFR